MSRKMKDSNNIWIGCIPVEWDIFKIKRYCKEIFPGATPQSTNPDFWDGDINWIPSGSCHDSEIRTAPKTITQEGYNNSSTRLVPKNTALVAMTGATCGNTGFLLIDSCTNQSVTAYIEDKNICNSRYLWYVLQCSKEYLLSYKTGGAQSGINVENCKNIYVPLVPISEQIKISGYLDDKLQEINNIITKTQASIEDYKKLKQSIITEAVTKGVRGDREMKDSGIDWVKELPKEWNSINPKALFIQRKDKAQEGDKQLTASQSLGVIFQDEYMRLTGTKIVTVEKDFSILKHVEAGDFVISMRSFQGGLEFSENTGSISSAYVMLIPNKNKVYDRYYKWLFKSSVYINALQSTSDLVRDGQAMRYSNFVKVRLFTVPLDEQIEISEYLDRKCFQIDELIRQKELYYKELENYKKSLIYEYVTGKKEVV